MNANSLQADHPNKDEVKSGVNIVDVARSYGVHLEKIGRELRGLCPFHDDVNNPNLYVNENKQVFNCQACGVGGDVFTFVMLKENCQFHDAVERLARQFSIGVGSSNSTTARERANRKDGVGASIPLNNTATLQQPTNTNAGSPGSAQQENPLFISCTLKQYSDDKGLPVDFLGQLGLSEMSYMGRQAVRIPYYDEDRVLIAVRFRTALKKSVQGLDNRFKWRKKDKPKLYGLNRLAEARSAGYVTIVEGESDAQTLWLHGEPALGVPGANTWRDEWADYFKDISIIYMVVEPDTGGETLKEKIRKSSIKERLRLVTLDEAKDASELYLQDKETFKTAWQAALVNAVPALEEARTEAEAKTKEAWALCSDLACGSDILDLFAQAIKSRVAGEVRVVKLLYLVLTSRLLPKPVSAAVKGPSSAGKSRVVEQTLAFFPASAYYALSGMSERALAYSNEPLAHRTMVFYEAVGMQGEFASYLTRTLLSEGRVRYETVEKTAQGLRPRLVEREGPTGLLVTTTAIHLHPENETRLLSIPITDTREQTTAVLQALATEAHETDETHDDNVLKKWWALQEWLERAEHRIIIPYARELAELVPPVAVRLRRDFGAFLNLIRTHALLHQASRQKDERGRLIATLEDYASVRELVYDIVAEGIDATVSQITRDTVEAVKSLAPGKDDTASTTQVAKQLRLDKGTASRRITACIEHGYLRNLETQKGRPSKLVVGDDLPNDLVILPTKESLEAKAKECCTVAPLQEGIDTPLPPQSAAPTGSSDNVASEEMGEISCTSASDKSAASDDISSAGADGDGTSRYFSHGNPHELQPPFKCSIKGGWCADCPKPCAGAEEHIIMTPSEDEDSIGGEGEDENIEESAERTVAAMAKGLQVTGVYLGWFEEDEQKPVVQRIQEAAARYLEKYGHAPTLALVHERDGGVNVEGMTVRVAANVQPNNYRLGME